MRAFGVAGILALVCLASYLAWRSIGRKQAPAVAVSHQASTIPAPPAHESVDGPVAPIAQGDLPIDVSVVESVIRTPQNYGGEHVDRLVALGPRAIPGIGELLMRGVEFPMPLIEALRKIGDPRGAEVALRFLKNMPAGTNADEGRIILALGSMRNPAVCAPIGEYLRNSSVAPGVRLSSVSTISRLCDGPLAKEAAQLVQEFYVNRAEHMRLRVSGEVTGSDFGEQDLQLALAEVKTDAATEMTVDVINRETTGYRLDPLIDVIARRNDPRLTAALRNLVQTSNTDVESHIRLKAARALLDLDRGPDEVLGETVLKHLPIAEEQYKNLPEPMRTRELKGLSELRQAYDRGR